MISSRITEFKLPKQGMFWKEHPLFVMAWLQPSLEGEEGGAITVLEERPRMRRLIVFINGTLGTPIIKQGLKVYQ